MTASPEPDHVAGLKSCQSTAITRKRCFNPFGKRPDRDCRTQAQNDRPARQRVRADRCQSENLGVGAHHRATGSQRVGCRSRRRTHNQPVTPVPRQQLIIDPHFQLDQPWHRPVADNKIVQSQFPVPLRIALILGLDQRSGFHKTSTAPDGIQRFFQVLRRTRCEKPQSSEVDPKQWNRCTRRFTSHPQHRAIASKRQQQLACTGHRSRVLKALDFKPGELGSQSVTTDFATRFFDQPNRLC